MKPRMTDGFLIELMDYFSSSRLGKPVNAAVIRDRIMQVNNRLIGDGMIAKVTLEGVYERSQPGTSSEKNPDTANNPPPEN